MSQRYSATVRGAIYGITAASIWGGMYVVSEVVLRVVPPFPLLVMRLVIGAAILGFILAYQRQLILPWRDVSKLLAVGIVGFGISLGAQFVGTAQSGALNGSVITSASPAFILLFGWLILREPLTPIRIGAVALASLGVLIVLDLSKFSLSSETFTGNIALTIAALTWGAYSVLIRRVSANYPILTISFYALVGGLFIAVPLALLQLQTTPIGSITLIDFLGILYLGVISTAIAMLLWNQAFALVEASVASLFFFAQPLVGVLLSTLLLGKVITPQLLIGGILIIGGVLLSMREPTPAKTSERAETA
jgi:drug/metabolite transporter (DMT)-like permease